MTLAYCDGYVKMFGILSNLISSEFVQWAQVKISEPFINKSLRILPNPKLIKIVAKCTNETTILTK